MIFGTGVDIVEIARFERLLREGMSWKDVEVVKNELGKPDLELNGRAAAIFAEKELKRSHTALSHDGAYAVAMVVLER